MFNFTLFLESLTKALDGVSKVHRKKGAAIADLG
jgi:hypothetical protein